MFSLFETMEIFAQPVKEVIAQPPMIRKKEHDMEIWVLRDIYSTVTNKSFKHNELGSKTIKSTKNERTQKHEFSSHRKNHWNSKYLKFDMQEASLKDLSESQQAVDQQSRVSQLPFRTLEEYYKTQQISVDESLLSTTNTSFISMNKTLDFSPSEQAHKKRRQSKSWKSQGLHFNENEFPRLHI